MKVLSEVINTYKETFAPLKNMFNEFNKTGKINPIITDFLNELGLKENEKTIYVACERIANLKTPILKSYLDESNKKVEENIKTLKISIPNTLQNKQKILDKAYVFTSKLYTEYFQKFIENVKEKKLLDNFYITLLEGSLETVNAFNDFYFVWSEHIEKQNDILDKMFGNDGEKIMNYLKEKNLLEKDDNENYTDRSYTVLKGGKMFSYAQVFPNQINKISQSIDDFIEKLQDQENKEKQAIINYLQAIKEAYLEIETTKLLGKWEKVDELWMQIKGPFQIVHPMEYYDDKYRKAVQPEFDIRILDTETLQSNVQQDVSFMFNELFSGFDKEKYEGIYNFSKESFSRVLLFVSEPVIYGGGYMNGLFSAQVVPNDEKISKKFGKKIFAFPNKVRAEQQKAPLRKHTVLTFDKNIIEEYKAILNDPKTYYQIYDIETIGHEFGHTLWMGNETEVKMNLKTGNFKNIEEWKATTGGLVAYFVKESLKGQDNELSEFDRKLMLMHFRRSVALMERKNFDEVAPYYNEGLIHLDILFKSEVLQIKDNKVYFNLTVETYKRIKDLYLETYKKLIKTYLDKKDAGEFLFDYVITDKNNYNLPKDDKLREFVIYYQEIFEKYGNEVVK